MKYTLKDYQYEAADKTLNNLARARHMYQQFGTRSQFSLAAVTGAGKTVISAGVIEALIFGSDEFDVEPDPGAVILWFSDDPAINEQSKARIGSAAPSLINRMWTIENDFALDSLTPGNVYFLNAQKLSKNARLVRAERSRVEDELAATLMAPPDMVQRSFYDILGNTIGQDGVTVYMFLDEAHRGMKHDTERTTIVQRLINGYRNALAMPVVVGISATVERFEETIKHFPDRDKLSSVTVDPVKVQDSGLIKDAIVLHIPDEQGQFDMVLLREGVKKLRAVTQEWDQYTGAEGTSPIHPLLVVQVPDKATSDELATILHTVYEAWPELPDTAVANVFGEHQDLKIAGYSVDYISPQDVQDAHDVRVLLAKEAISTGWDCPRAEVLVSFRPAVDQTHITQLLGRLMRTPLAMRIPGNEPLNSVTCFLPFFEKETALKVADRLMKGGTSKDDDELNPGGQLQVLIEPVEAHRNQDVDERVWDVMASLPSQTIPQGKQRPIKRLQELAQRLSKDGILDNAYETAMATLCRALDGRIVQYQDEIDSISEDIWTMTGLTISHGRGQVDPRVAKFTATADYRSIAQSLDTASRTLTAGLTDAFVKYKMPADATDNQILDIQVMTAASAQVPQIVKDIDQEGESLTRKWLDETRVERKNLNDLSQARYDRIESMSTEPERTDLIAPEAAQVATVIRQDDGTEIPIPTYEGHILVDEDGRYPAQLNTWEIEVVETELARPGTFAWYRNPSRTSKESLAIAYDDGTGRWKALRPDFLFFANVNGEIVVDLVDPHGHHLADALPKLRGLAQFAREYGTAFRRIEALTQIDGKLRVLDLLENMVCRVIDDAESAEDLYLHIGRDYR